jgi:hypothetical protein
VSAATDLVELELEAYARGLASFMDGLDPKADVDEGEMAIYGSCPMATAGGGENGVVIILNYGDECTNDRYGSAKLSGTATVTVLGQIWGAVVPDFTIDGTTIVGGANCNRLADREAGATLQGNITFTSEGIGQGLGPATVSFDLDTSVITISEAEITLKNTTGVTDTPDTIRYDVIFDNVVIDPVGNGNFTPQSGNVSFVGPGDSGTIVVTYSSESPDSGVVEVTVGDAEAVDYVVTGLN